MKVVTFGPSQYVLQFGPSQYVLQHLSMVYFPNHTVVLGSICYDSVSEVRRRVVTNTNCTNLLFRDICGIG